MLDPDKILDNPLFFRWVFNPTDDVERYWQHYINSNPTQKEELLSLKAKLKGFKVSNAVLSHSEKYILASQIEKSIAKSTKSNKILILGRRVVKYAAVALIASIISSLIVYSYIENRNSRRFVNNLNFGLINFEDPVLVMSTGNKINLEKEESTVEYSKSKGIIVNNAVQEDLVRSNKPVINQLSIPYGNRTKLKLIDGTQVWLNSGSKLVYPSFFTGNQREVLLIGEAYFEVAHDKYKPFLVKTPSLDIKVLGTKFNVSDYADDPFAMAVLEDGEVAVKQNDSGIFAGRTHLSKDQAFYLNKADNVSTVRQVNADQFVSWREGYYQFSDMELNRLVWKIERYYNIECIINDARVGTELISGKLDLTEDIDLTLSSLSLVANVKFKQISKNKYEITRK